MPAPLSSFELRTMEGCDYDRVLSLWQNTEGVGLNSSDSRPAIEAFLLRNPGLSRLAQDPQTSELLGAVLCGHDGRRGYLHHLAVARPHRRRGIARALVEACLADLRALSIDKCNLFLFANNRAGRAFWEHSGWSAREDLVLIQYPLTAPAAASSRPAAIAPCAPLQDRTQHFDAQPQRFDAEPHHFDAQPQRFDA